jgi:hypothetical protein
MRKSLFIAAFIMGFMSTQNCFAVDKKSVFDKLHGIFQKITGTKNDKKEIVPDTQRVGNLLNNYTTSCMDIEGGKILFNRQKNGFIYVYPKMQENLTCQQLFNTRFENHIQYRCEKPGFENNRTNLRCEITYEGDFNVIGYYETMSIYGNTEYGEYTDPHLKFSGDKNPTLTYTNLKVIH